MAYVKALIAGIVALFAALVLFVLIVVFVISPLTFHGCCVSYDPGAFIRFNPFISGPLAFLIFAGGFCWEFRRASKVISPQ